MEVNKEEALRCHDIALTKESRGEIAAALKFIRKSLALFPTPEAQASLDRVSKLNAAESATPNSTPGDTPKRATFNSTPTSRSDSKPKQSSSNNQRGYTAAQLEAVKKIKANSQDYYSILGVSKTATDSEIKKAYRKLALQFHPDKNSAPGADEAFKLVSKAFAILGDADKRAQYDRFGGDPEQRGGGRGGGSAASYSPYHEEVSPEDLFNMFFGGGLGGGGGGFQSATFVGPDGRRYVRQFGGSQQRRHTTTNQGNEGVTFNFLQLLPVLLLLGFSFLSSLFQDSGPSVPQYAFPKINEYNPNVLKTRQRGVPYIASPIEVRNFHKKAGERRFARFESDLENYYIQSLSINCREERDALERDRITAGGIFGWGRDEDKLREMKNRKLPHCDALRQFVR